MAADNPHEAVLTSVEAKNLRGYIETFGKGRCYSLNQNFDKMRAGLTVPRSTQRLNIAQHHSTLRFQGHAQRWLAR